MRRFEPDMKEARDLMLAVLASEANYRRDLGAFGAEDKRTKRSAHRLRFNIRNMRAWYASRFGSDDLRTSSRT